MCGSSCPCNIPTFNSIPRPSLLRLVSSDPRRRFRPDCRGKEGDEVDVRAVSGGAPAALVLSLAPPPLLAPSTGVAFDPGRAGALDDANVSTSIDDGDNGNAFIRVRADRGFCCLDI